MLISEAVSLVLSADQMSKGGEIFTLDMGEQYKIIEGCSWGPYLELFARGKRKKWTVWGNESKFYNINWKTYKNNSSVK